MDGNTSDHSLPASDHTGGTWIQCWDKDIRSVSRLNLDSNSELNGLVEDKEIAARAVALVVNSSRKGIVPLCADVANLLRAKKSLEKDIILLKQQNNTLHSSSASMQTSHSTSPTPTSLNSYQDVPAHHDHNSNCQELSRPCSRCSQSSSTMSNSPKTDKLCGNKLSGYSFQSHTNNHSGGGGGSNSSSSQVGKLSGGSSSPPSPTILSKCLLPRPSSSAESSPTSQHHGIITQAIVHHPPDSPTPPPLDILRESPNSICDGPLDIQSLADSSSSDRLHEKPTSDPGHKGNHFLPEMVSKPISAVPKSNATVSKEIQCILSPSIEGLEETMKLNLRLAENLAAALKEIDLLKGRLKELEMNQLARQSTEYHSFIVTQMSAGVQPLPHVSLNCPVVSLPAASAVSTSPPSPQPNSSPECTDQSEMPVVKGRVKEQVKLFVQQAASQTSSSHLPCPQDGRNNTLQPPPIVNGSRKPCPAVPKKPVRNPFACPLPLCKCDSCEEALTDKPIPSDQQTRFYPVNPNLYVRVNDHIVVRGDRTGYIRYIGHLNKIGPPNTVFIGLELDAPVGVNNGFFNGKRYFECPNEHGLFVTFSDVVCLVKKLVPARKPILSNATASDDETLEPASMTDSASSDQVSSTDSQSTSPDPIVWKNHYHNTPDQSCHQQAILRKSVHL